MTTVSEEKEVQEGISPEAAPESPCGQVRTRGTSVALPAGAALTAVTERVRKAGQSASRAVALLDKPGSLVHSQPPTFKQARDRHHECADHYQMWRFMAWLRLVWGYFHLLVIMPVLYLVVWVTESPGRFLVTAVLAAVIWFFR